MKLASRLGQGLGIILICLAAVAALVPSLIERATWFYGNWQVMTIGIMIIVAVTCLFAFLILRRRDKC